jgi:glycosyltransferase involved in cell wall biosynthesis
MSDLITKSFKIEKDKISVLPYLLEKSKNNWKPIEKREFSICIVGRLSLSKGHKNLLYAFNECIKIDPKLKLLIVGDGPEKKTLQKLTKSLKQKSHVVFLGNIPNRDIGTIFSKCFASISASRSEAFGIVNIESLREGTPVICTNTEGAKDIIVNGKNGFIVDLTKKNDLAKKIELILKNWKKYSNNALQTFEKEYDKHNIPFHCQMIVNELKKKNI